VRGIVYGWARSLFGAAPPAPSAMTHSVVAIPHLIYVSREQTDLGIIPRALALNRIR